MDALTSVGHALSPAPRPVAVGEELNAIDGAIPISKKIDCDDIGRGIEKEVVRAEELGGGSLDQRGCHGGLSGKKESDKKRRSH